MSERKVAICEVMSLTDALSLGRQLQAGDEQLRAVGECHTGGTPWEVALLPEIVLIELGGRLQVVIVGRREIIHVKCTLAFLMTSSSRLKELQPDASAQSNLNLYFKTIVFY